MENAQMNNNEEQQTRSPTAPLDKEGGGTAALVETNDAQDSVNTWWSEEKKVAFIEVVEGERDALGCKTTPDKEFWCEHVFPILLQNGLTKDIANKDWTSMRTKYRGFVSTLNKANETLVREIKSNVGKNGAVYKDPSGNFYSGKGESDGREFVAQVYHQVVYCDRKKRPSFVAEDYAHETCKHALFEYFYSHYVVWEKPTAKVLNIRELGKTKKIKKNREANADEEASTEKAEASTKTASAEPRTAEKSEVRDNLKRVKRGGEQKSQLKCQGEIENERLQLQKKSVEAKAKVASEVEKQNELKAEKNKLTAEQNKLSAETNTRQSAQALFESSSLTKEEKQRAKDTLLSFLPNTSTR